MVCLRKIICVFFLCVCGMNIVHAESIYNVPQDSEIFEIIRSGLQRAEEKIDSNTASEQDVYQWVNTTLTSREVVSVLLDSEELRNVPDDQQINISPIEYTFSSGRHISLEYKTSKKILKQHLSLDNKRDLNDLLCGQVDEDGVCENIWINTDPAWYAVLVVQHDTLKDLVGPDKDNIISMQYIQDNIDNIYPHGYFCTSKTAIANDTDVINKAGVKTVDMEDDSNDYYVAGDADLGWIVYAEIVAEIALTVLTMGAGEAGLLAVKGARAAKTAKTLHKTAKTVGKTKDVVEFVAKASKSTGGVKQALKTLEVNMKNVQKYDKVLQELKTLDAVRDADKYRELTKELDNIYDAAKKVDPDLTVDVLRDCTQYSKSKDIMKYKDVSVQINKMRDLMSAIDKLKLRKQTGNTVAKSLKSLKNIFKHRKSLDTAAKVARTTMSSTSGRISTFLFDTTLKFGGNLAKFVRNTGALYGAVVFLGDLYDYTSDETAEFTNGINFKPLGLLSADDIPGQENVVNYGMWLMWIGNSTMPEDDDAAYLQAIDFASKFHYNLNEVQDKMLIPACNVDMYVVRPIIKLDKTTMNSDKPTGELFYLVMNDYPWSTAEDFSKKVTDLGSWERDQQDLLANDPNCKNTNGHCTDDTTENANSEDVQ